MNHTLHAAPHPSAVFAATSNVVRVPFRPTLTLLAKIAAAVKTWRNRQVAMRQLSAMPDALLRDIGIERHQIRDTVLHGAGRAEIIPIREDQSAVQPQAATQPVVSRHDTQKAA